MAMSNGGLTKACEEISELQIELGQLGQILCKKMAYPDTDIHPDNAGSMQQRMEDEMGDVIGSIQFLIKKQGLDAKRIEERAAMKLARFTKWDSEV